VHLGVNLRKAFLSALELEDGPQNARKYNCVDSLVHELFGAHGVPEYTCGAQTILL